MKKILLPILLASSTILFADDNQLAITACKQDITTKLQGEHSDFVSIAFNEGYFKTVDKGANIILVVGEGTYLVTGDAVGTTTSFECSYNTSSGAVVGENRKE